MPGTPAPFPTLPTLPTMMPGRPRDVDASRDFGIPLRLEKDALEAAERTSRPPFPVPPFPRGTRHGNGRMSTPGAPVSASAPSLVMTGEGEHGRPRDTSHAYLLLPVPPLPRSMGGDTALGAPSLSLQAMPGRPGYAFRGCGILSASMCLEKADKGCIKIKVKGAVSGVRKTKSLVGRWLEISQIAETSDKPNHLSGETIYDRERYCGLGGGGSRTMRF